MRRVALVRALGLAGWGTLLATAAARAQPTPAVLAATPYMGWDTYFALPGGFPESKILQEADRLKTSGLEAKGYRLIWLDAGWWQGQGDPPRDTGVSPHQRAHGRAWAAHNPHA